MDAATIEAPLTDPRHRDAAGELAARIADEDGAGQVVSTVEQLAG